MPTDKAAVPVAEPTTTKSKTYTNWKAFEQAKLAPVTIKCEGYRPVFGADYSCHSALLLKGQVLKNHIDNDHGGGFRFFLKATEGKTHPIWQELQDLGLEAHDFRCEICDKTLRFAPASIIPHLKPHSGKTRRVFPGSTFNMVLSAAKPEEVLDDTETGGDE